MFRHLLQGSAKFQSGLCDRAAMSSLELIAFACLIAAIFVFGTWVSVLPVNAADAAPSLQEFEKGKALLDQHQLAEAESSWAAVRKDDLYGPVALILLARAYRDKHDAAKSEALYRDALNHFSNSIYGSLVKKELVDLLVQEGKAEAVPLLAELIRGADAKSKPRLLLSLAQLEARLGRYHEAAKHYKTLYVQFPASVEGLHAAEALRGLAARGRIESPTYTLREKTQRARLLYQAGRFDLAAEVYEGMLKEQPSDQSLRLKLATCQYKDRKNQSAVNLLKEILKTNPPASLRLEALYLLSRLYWRLERDKDFELCCKALVDSGNERFRKIALFNLGAYNFEKKRFEAARDYFDRLSKLGPDAKMAFQTKWRMAWISYLKGDFAKSAHQFQQLKTMTASVDLQYPCLYWQGRSLLKLNKTEEAVKLFKEICERAPMSYYGYESADVLKTLKIQTHPMNGQADKFPDATLSASLRANPRAAQAVKLQELNLHEFALLNFDALPTRLQAEPAIALLRARSAYLLGQYSKARAALSCAYGKFMDNPPKDAPREFVEMAFPRVHYEETLRQASRHALDPNLVWSIIRQESLYDPCAVSPAGAVGLMQVMPNVSGLADASRKASPSVIQQLLDPRQNLTIGARILKKNLTTFGGNIVLAVASYNADIRKVKSWMKSNGALAPDEFIEMIPYQETRLYVKRVLAGSRTYRILHSRQNLAELW